MREREPVDNALSAIRLRLPHKVSKLLRCGDAFPKLPMRGGYNFDLPMFGLLTLSAAIAACVTHSQSGSFQ